MDAGNRNSFRRPNPLFYPAFSLPYMNDRVFKIAFGLLALLLAVLVALKILQTLAFYLGVVCLLGFMAFLLINKFNRRP